MEPCETHLRMPSRVLFFTPAISAVSSTMQLNILRWGGSGARMAASGLVTRGGKVLRRIFEARSGDGVEGVVIATVQPGLWALVEAMVCEPDYGRGRGRGRVCWAPEQSVNVGAQSQGVTILGARVCRSAGANESIWSMAQAEARIVGRGRQVGQVKLWTRTITSFSEVHTPSRR
jgi:hypothetical protein